MIGENQVMIYEVFPFWLALGFVVAAGLVSLAIWLYTKMSGERHSRGGMTDD